MILLDTYSLLDGGETTSLLHRHGLSVYISAVTCTIMACMDVLHFHTPMLLVNEMSKKRASENVYTSVTSPAELEEHAVPGYSTTMLWLGGILCWPSTPRQSYVDNIAFVGIE